MRRASGKSVNRVVALSTGALAICWAAWGCERAESVREADESSAAALTSSDIRAARRMYDGAPPVIPHPPLGADCHACHTSIGRVAPPIGVAPANPHSKTAHFVGQTNCKQCHVFTMATDVFWANGFVGVGQTLATAERLYATAPPVMPHPLFMREDCQACHGGVAARPEIRCDHLNRVNCRQCHVSGDRPQRFVGAIPQLSTDAL